MYAVLCKLTVDVISVQYLLQTEKVLLCVST